MGEYVEIQSRDGGVFSAYTATPRLGRGPGVVLLHDIFGITRFVREKAEQFAEEGYVVVVPDLFWRIEAGVELGYCGADLQRASELHNKLELNCAIDDIVDTAEAVRGMKEHVGKVGVVGYHLGGHLATLVAAQGGADCGVSYYPALLDRHLPDLAKISVPFTVHLAGADEHSTPERRECVIAEAGNNDSVAVNVYRGAAHAFADPYRDGYDPRAADVADARTLGVLRAEMGPHHDLNALWDEHLRCEFEANDVEATMATMASAPYVNYVPTMTGGAGCDMLTSFYEHHFVNDNDPKWRIIPVSRTVGADRIVDEFIACFTHDQEISWMLPAVLPTGKWVEVPIVAVARFCGGKLQHKHIYWDQASVLAQIGLLDTWWLPVSGVAQARKLVDETLPFNELVPE